MRFNPLWFVLLMVLFAVPGVLFLLPVLLILLLLLAGGALVGGFSADGMARLPAVWWSILTRRPVRANFALAHATAALIRARTGYIVLVRGENDGFFISSLGDGMDFSPTAYELSIQALARLKNGEKNLVVLPESRVFRSLAFALAAVPLGVLLLPVFPLGLIAAAVAGYFAAPALSPAVQKLFLSSAPVEELTVQSVRNVSRTVSVFGGRLNSLERGIEVATSVYASDTIEAEIVEE